MSAKLILASMALLAATATYAGTAPSPDRWTRETRPVGNKVVMDVYHRAAPYALTGSTSVARSTTGDEWVRETRQLGNKTSIDVYFRR